MLTSKLDALIEKAFRQHDGWEELRIMVPPVPASRPRVCKFGSYYTHTYKNWMTEAAKSLGRGTDPDGSGLYLVLISHVCTKAKTTKLTVPAGDLDNYDKAALDAVTKCGRLWDDDKQVAACFSVKRFPIGSELPGTYIMAHKLEH